MKPETIIKKVTNLQKQLTSEPNDEFIKEAVEYYLS
jgi:hypothetical protein